MSEPSISPTGKLDPETLAIRTKPARAMRFRCGVIIAVAALGSVSLVVVAWIALKPRVFSAVADRQELSEPSNRPSRSEEHTSELQSLMRISYVVFCLKKQKKQK